MEANTIGFDVYLAMRSAWLRRLPEVLENEDPDLLMRLLKLADTKDGIAQSVAMKELNINQSRMSKLKDKLILAKWVEVWKPDSNRRLLLMSTTQKAKTAIDLMLEEMLSHSLHASKQLPPLRRG